MFVKLLRPPPPPPPSYLASPYLLNYSCVRYCSNSGSNNSLTPPLCLISSYLSPEGSSYSQQKLEPCKLEHSIKLKFIQKHINHQAMQQSESLLKCNGLLLSQWIQSTSAAYNKQAVNKRITCVLVAIE